MRTHGGSTEADVMHERSVTYIGVLMCLVVAGLLLCGVGCKAAATDVGEVGPGVPSAGRCVAMALVWLGWVWLLQVVLWGKVEGEDVGVEGRDVG